jgi:hypothetical protein
MLRRRFRITDATINNGIFPPAMHQSVWIFATEHKAKDRFQYHDLLRGDVLEWEGQRTRKWDPWVVNHVELERELVVFYRRDRKQYPGEGFRYEGVFRFVGHPKGWRDPGKGPARYILERIPAVAAPDWADRDDVLSEEITLGRARGQGRQLSPEARKAIDKYAMARAIAHFESENYDVTDESSRQPYDLRCTKDDETLYVEVKGTTSHAEAIRITHGEFQFNRRNSVRMALFVLHSINLLKDGDDVQAEGGMHEVKRPWVIKKENLTPLSYVLRLRK